MSRARRHAPFGEVPHGCLSEHLLERAGKGGARHVGELGEFFDSPRSFGQQGVMACRAALRRDPPPRGTTPVGPGCGLVRLKSEYHKHVEQPVEHRLPSGLFVQHLPRQQRDHGVDGIIDACLVQRKHRRKCYRPSPARCRR